MGRFGSDVSAFVDQAKARVDGAAGKIAHAVFAEVISASPEENGFRAGWQVRIDGGTTRLVNTMSHARAVEYGQVKDAPGGMVRLAVQSFPVIVARVVAR